MGGIPIQHFDELNVDGKTNRPIQKNIKIVIKQPKQKRSKKGKGNG